MSIITLAEAKAHLKVDQTVEDDLIEIYIDAAIEYIGVYLNDANYTLNPAIKAAALLLVADYYENRGSDPVAENSAVARLLHPYRKNLGI